MLSVLRVCFFKVLGLNVFKIVFFRVGVFWCLGFWGFAS